MVSPPKTWKKAELEICKILGGRRRGASFIQDSGDAGTTDCVHPGYAVEVKHDKAPSWSLMVSGYEQAKINKPYPDDLPFVVVHKKGSRYAQALCCMALSDFTSNFGLPKVNITAPKFMTITSGWHLNYIRKKVPTFNDMFSVNILPKIGGCINPLVVEKLNEPYAGTYVIMNIIEFRDTFIN